MRNVRLAAALKAAHDAQMALLPQGDPQVPGFEVTGACLPTYEVGGDFYDFFPLDPEGGVLGIAVGDVSGKGMRAAMTAALASGMVRAEAGRRATVSEMMTSLNRSVRGKTERHMFTALCLASVDSSEHELTVVNAGLCEPLLKSGAAATYLGAEGPSLPLGAFPDTAYRSRTVRLGPGDAAIFYTDGVPEAADRHGVQYGYEALARFVGGLDSGLSGAGIKDAVLREVVRFSGGARRQDDVAVVVVRRL